MKISDKILDAITNVIMGVDAISPYRKGQELVEFFNRHGDKGVYGSGFPSRYLFTKDKVGYFNSIDKIEKIIEDAIDPRYYPNLDNSKAVKYLNDLLQYDELEIVKEGIYFKLKSVSNQSKVSQNFTETLDIKNDHHLYILKQHDKCTEKLESGDYEGAITNARTMLEAVCGEIIPNSAQYDGDLNKLFKETKNNIDLGSLKDLSDTLKQILSGLYSVVGGLAGISNKMGDRHARQHKAEKQHAILASDAAYTLSKFLLASQIKSE